MATADETETRNLIRAAADTATSIFTAQWHLDYVAFSQLPGIPTDPAACEQKWEALQRAARALADLGTLGLAAVVRWDVERTRD